MARKPKPNPETLVVGALLTALVALGQISMSVYLPSLPSLVETLGTTAERVNLTLSVFLAGFAVSHLVYGPLSDRFGRRPVLLFGVALYFVASLACALSPTIEALIAARFLQSVGACAGPVIGRAVVRDVYGPDRSAKALAYIGVAFAVSPAVTPIIGGYLHVWFGWRANFFFMAGVAVVVLTCVWTLLEETNTQFKDRKLHLGSIAATYGMLLRSPGFLGHMFAFSFIFGGLMAFTAASPFLFIDVLGLSPDRFGLIIIFNVFGFLAGTLAAGRLAGRYSVETMAWAGILISLAGGAAMAAFALAGHIGAAALIVPMGVFLAGMGIVFPNCMAGAMAPFPKDAGAASALMGAFQMAVASAASVAAGWLPRDSAMGVALVITALALAALAAFSGLTRRRRTEAKASPP